MPSSKKNLHVKVLCGRFLSEVQSVTLVFRPSFVNCCPSNLLSGSRLPPLSLSHVNTYTVYTYTVCKGGGVWGSGLRQINNCHKVPLQVTFLDDDILHCLL